MSEDEIDAVVAEFAQWADPVGEMAEMIVRLRAELAAHEDAEEDAA